MTRTPEAAPRSPSDYLLVSEVFPPSVGGSGVLLENVYARVTGGQVTALVDGPDVREGPGQGNITVRRAHFGARSWSLFDPRAWPNQCDLARLMYRLGSHGRAVVHCGRAQPEAVPALLASLMPGGPRYVFWAHGEDIAATLSSRQFSATMRLVYRRASAAIANSRNTARMIDSIGWAHGKTHVVYPGVDSQRFRPNADDGSLRARLAPGGETVLLSVARLQKRKGHDLVIKALPELLRHAPRLRYIIVGDGDQRESLRALVGQLHLESVVQFEGAVHDDALPAYFSACDVFVLPTRVEPYDFEGFGIVYLEAAAAGKPSVGGRNGGVPEAVAEGETGVLVSGENVEELVAALRTLCASASARHRMGAAGRARALRDFTWEKAAAAVSEIHRGLATRNGRASRGPAPLESRLSVQRT
jgi:phosphatidylinositol alpha-1,6-mannosyltransferase